MALTKAQASTILTRLGFRVDTSFRYTQALKNFQLGWNLGTALSSDGVKGAKTDAALLLSEARRVRGLGTASVHFSFMEMRCKCGGKYADCKRVWTPRSVFAKMEVSRAKVGHSISILSGCRCPNYNASIDGALSSRHMAGDAVDWIGPDKDITRSWNIWRGVGYGGKSDRSLHTDIRPIQATWIYPGW